jgi:prepilin-type N-terminal cleavage/methylation domain-containing protein
MHCKKYHAGMHCKQSPKGFALIELAVVIFIASLMATFGFSLYSSSVKNKVFYMGQINVQQADISIRQFILKNKRLPCPDVNKDNIEDLNSNGECQSGLQVGFLPYASLGIVNEKIIDEDEWRIVYGVYRGNIDYDLTSSKELNMGSLLEKLRKLDNVKKGSIDSPFIPVTSEGSVEAICSVKPPKNPAYILYAALENQNNNQRGGNKNCFYTDPITFVGSVKAVSSAELLGALRQFNQ